MDNQIEFQIKANPLELTETIITKAKETQEEFIFKTISDFFMFEYEMRITKKELTDALAKQHPMKPRYSDEWHCYCGRCNKRLSLKHKPQYCMRCGQKVKL